MKILIFSLQVSKGGSHGHLHPALELAYEAKKRGHDVALMPLPSALTDDESCLLNTMGIHYIAPSPLPSNILYTPSELGKIAQDPHQVHLAYQSFLVDPLLHQLNEVIQLTKAFAPNAILFDMLVYLAKVAASRLSIPEIGFCAGLKLVAPTKYQAFYKEVTQKILPKRKEIFNKIDNDAQFHHLEIMAKRANLVFAPEFLVGKGKNDKKIHCVGPLHISSHRDETAFLPTPTHKFGILCFGSVLDPADYPSILTAAIESTKTLGLNLYITSKKLIQNSLPNHVFIHPYLPLTTFIPKAEFFIHHGGANSFSESLFLGAKQILIPLTTDQPMQAYYLKQARAGFTLKPSEVTMPILTRIISRLMDPKNEVHHHIKSMAQLYQSTNGAENTLQIIEEMVAYE